jgi:hypothetical protein
VGSQNPPSDSQRQTKEQEGGSRPGIIRNYLKDHPISKIMTLLAVLSFTIAVSVSSLLWSLKIALVGLSFFGGAIIFRFAFESSPEGEGPWSKSGLWPTISSIELGEGTAVLHIYGANLGGQDPSSMSEISQVWLDDRSLKYDENERPRIELWQSEHIRVRLPPKEEAHMAPVIEHLVKQDGQAIVVVHDPYGRATAPHAVRPRYRT